MDKSCQSSAEPTASAATSSSRSSDGGNANANRDQYIRHLHKVSHKITKPTIKNPPIHHLQQTNQRPPPPPPQPPLQQPPVLLSSSQSQGLQQQTQPPVYNINKNDFREVVQKLTGSPAHERISTPAPIHAPKPSSSRLQRFRPPPLAQIGIARPTPLLNCAIPPPQNALPVGASPSASAGGGNVFCGNGNSMRFVGTPLSPLPPLPTCHAAAESPISAYMRLLHSSTSAVDSDPKQVSGIPPFPPLASLKFHDVPILNHQMVPQQQALIPAPPVAAAIQSDMPPPQSSPLPFGCFPSPKSPCPVLSPSRLFSPTGTGQFGFPQMPISPRVLPPVPSPK
ncbi:hypothetical protein Ancab_038400 [Ancistrocladus abbreviatus]